MRYLKLPIKTHELPGLALPEGLPLANAAADRQFEFFEWPPDGHLRHSRFVGLREDKKALEVERER